jgi:hypothetical protein
MNPIFKGARDACRAEPRLLTVIHTLMLAGLTTTAAILSTAVDLGPYGPLLIALGLYLGLFCATVELLLFVRRAWLVVEAWIERRSADQAPSQSKPGGAL